MSKVAQSPIREDRRWLIIGVSVFLYSVSFTLPTVHEGLAINLSGIDAYQHCWQILMNPKSSDSDWWNLGIAWFANPAIWFSILCVMSKAWILGLISSGSAILVSLPVLLRYGSAIVPYPGYWAWFGSGLILFVTSVRVIFFNQRPFQTTE